MITNKFLEEVAQAISGESFSIPIFTAVTGDIVSSELAETSESLHGEIGTRKQNTITRSENIVSFSAIRSGTTDLVSSLGDTLDGFGTFVDVTGDSLMTGVVFDIPFTHTSSFDVEFITSVTVDRITPTE